MPLSVSVVTPEREVWSAEADFLLARAADGDIGIMPGHAPVLASLHHSRLIVHVGDGHTYMAVHGGFLEVLDDRVTVLTSVAEIAEEIDIERARRQRQEAERMLAQEDTPANRDALLRASNRLETAAEAGLLEIG